MPQYMGQFYTGRQAAGDALREVLQGIARGRAESREMREQRRIEEERAQLQRDRADERTYQRGRDAQGDARLAAQDADAAKNAELARALNLSQLRERGIFQGPAPTNATASVDFSGLGGVGASAVPDPTRYAALGSGFYEDRDATPMARVKRAAARALAGDVEGAVANGMTPDAALQVVNRPGSAGALSAKRSELALQDEFNAKADQRQFGYSSRLASQRAANQPGPKLATVPMKVVEQTLDSEALVGALGSLDSLLQTNEGADAVGLFDGAFPTFMVNKTGQQVRSAISNVNSTLMKLRSGAAVTPSEAKRLEDFTITKWDDEATMRTKVAQLREFLANRARDNREYYSQDNGFKALPPVRSAAPVPQDTTAAASEQRTMPKQGRARVNPF
jgi:hypothetical protein